MYDNNFMPDEHFLNFAKISLFSFTEEGKPASLKPAGSDFHGWDASNFFGFNINKHFLSANQLTWEAFTNQVLFGDLPEAHFVWQKPCGTPTHPLPTLWQKRETANGQIEFIAFIREDQKQPAKTLQSKKYFYQAYNLPGFIHNISGPLGVIFGRTELLSYKHPEISDFEEMLRTSRRLRAIIENFNMKISSERYAEEVPINLNRFLSQELTFLDSDLFFKHKVEKLEDFSEKIPEFPTNYATLSAVISECYYFFRQYIDENKRYMFAISTFRDDDKVGFNMEFMGDFSSPQKEMLPLPYQFEGSYRDLPQSSSSAIDTLLLAECLRSHQGEIKLSCEASKLSLTYQFLLPENSGRNRL